MKAGNTILKLIKRKGKRQNLLAGMLSLLNSIERQQILVPMGFQRGKKVYDVLEGARNIQSPTLRSILEQSWGLDSKTQANKQNSELNQRRRTISMKNKNFIRFYNISALMVAACGNGEKKANNGAPTTEITTATPRQLLIQQLLALLLMPDVSLGDTQRGGREDVGYISI